MQDINLKSEIVRVREEVQFFRTECLPRFFATVENGALIEWQCAADRLADGLTDKYPAPLRKADYEQFLFCPADGSYSYRQGRIVWEFSLYAHVASALLWAKSVVGEPSQDVAEMRDRLTANVEPLKHWLLSLPVDDPDLWNSMCVLLPQIVDHDPGFAERALDRATWEEIVHCDARLTSEQKDCRLRFIEGIWFAHVWNNALLHVLGALANNNFMRIGEFLDHPNLMGRYTHLMPHYLFAVLFEKVKVLCKLGGIERNEVSE